MSMIIYGPKGCGKTRNAEALREFFRCDKVVDDGYYPYPKSKQQDVKFESGNDLYLTHEDPPHRCQGAERRIIDFTTAMKAMAAKQD